MQIILRLFLFILSIGCLNSYSQCGNYTGNINDLPVCGQYGDANGNSNWNWELTDQNDPAYCSMWYARTDNSGNLTLMSSPFVNANIVILDNISQQRDFTRDKGWELLRRDFGCSHVTAYPYFILYNKYTGLMRLFIYTPVGQPQYSGIAAEIIANTNNAYPATTAFSDTIQTAPDKFLTSTPSGNFGKGMVAIGEPGGIAKWSLVEFNPSYDPNIQNAIYTGASLQVTINGVINNNMAASIKGGSVTSNNIVNYSYRPTQNKTAPASDGSFDFKGVGEKFIRFSQGVTTIRTEVNNTATSVVNFLTNPGDTLLKKVRNTFDAIKKATETTGAFQDAFGKMAQAAKAVGSFFKVFAAVEGLISSLSGVSSGGPSYTTYDLVLQGTITAKVISTTFLLRIPGTLQPNNDNATYYKCPLGIFNITNTPQADVVTYNKTDRFRPPLSGENFPVAINRAYVSYKMRNNLTVSFNQGAGLELVSAQAAIVGEILPNADGTASYDLFEKHNSVFVGYPLHWRVTNFMRSDLESDRLEIKHFDPIKQLHVFQTPYTNIECLNGLAFNAVATTKVYLQVKAVLKRTGDPANTPIIYLQNYLIETYPATISNQNDYIGTDSRDHLPPYANYTELPLYESDLIVSNWTYTGPDVDKADNSVTTNNAVIVAPGAQVTFAAGGVVNLYPGFEAQYGSDFTAKINNFGYTLNCGTLQVASPVLLTNCYNTNITALSQNTSETATYVDEVAAGELKVFPTLSSGNVNITGKELQQALIVIVDQSGRMVYRYQNKSNKTSIQLNLHHLTNGVYFIKIDSPGQTVTQKLLISK